MKTILLANDNPVTIELFYELLDSYDYCIVTCDNEPDAINELKVIIPDLIISGFKFDDISENKILQEIKENPDVKKTPIIFLTENTSFTYINKIYEENDNITVLHEPVKFSYLMKLIAEKINQNLENGT